MNLYSANGKRGLRSSKSDSYFKPIRGIHTQERKVETQTAKGKQESGTEEGICPIEKIQVKMSKVLSRIDALVHLVNLLLVSVCDLLPLDLLSSSHHSVLRCPLLGKWSLSGTKAKNGNETNLVSSQNNTPKHLHGLEPVLLSEGVTLCLHKGFHLLICAQLLQGFALLVDICTE